MSPIPSPSSLPSPSIDRSDIFGHGGAEREAQKLGLKFLGAIPLHMDIRERSDSGEPITASAPRSREADIYREIAARAWDEIQAPKGVEVPLMKVSPARDSLKVTFKDGFSYDLPAELLRVMSPSAEVQGHSQDQRGRWRANAPSRSGSCIRSANTQPRYENVQELER